MQETQAIVHYLLVSEIDASTDSLRKFNNSDKPWSEANLGYNNPASKIISDAITDIGNNLLVDISKS